MKPNGRHGASQPPAADDQARTEAGGQCPWPPAVSTVSTAITHANTQPVGTQDINGNLPHGPAHGGSYQHRPEVWTRFPDPSAPAQRHRGQLA